jgi:putative spermidine/putrescine transport system ATP-binding protein
MAYLDILNLRKAYGPMTAVHSMNLSVERGEFISFLGPSGCGKTTTLRMIAGLDRPTDGVIRLDGKDVTTIPVNRRNVGLVFQNYALFPNMTVADNIGFGLRIAGRPAKEIAERVGAMLDIIKMGKFGQRYPHQLSGGQQQRVALARALAKQPDILLLDEPLSALDAKIRIDLRAEIRSIQRSLGITTIYVTHDQEEALSLSDRIVVMRDGRVEQVGAPNDIYNHPATPFVASFVGTLNRLESVADPTDRFRIGVDGQPVYLPNPLPAGNGGKAIVIGLRPENVTVIGPRDELDPMINRLKGTVEGVAFLGSIVRIEVRLGRNTLTFDGFNDPRRDLPRIGDVVSVGFERAACLILGGVDGLTVTPPSGAVAVAQN